MISFLIRIGFCRKPAPNRRAAAPACEAQDPLSHPAIARMDARMLADLPFPAYQLSETRPLEHRNEIWRPNFASMPKARTGFSGSGAGAVTRRPGMFQPQCCRDTGR